LTWLFFQIFCPQIHSGALQPLSDPALFLHCRSGSFIQL
jgi:hypothetical protein